jgi:hypothetical protein
MKRLAVFALLAALTGGWRAGAAAPPKNAAPAASAAEDTDQVMVIVFVRPGWWDQVGITFNQKVPTAQARKDVAEIARRTGWNLDPVRVTHEAATPGGPVMTSVEFAAPAVDPRTHSLPVEPFVLALRRFRRVSVMFVLPEGFPYWGPLSHQAPGIAMRGERVKGTYTFHFTIIDPKIQAFKLPLRNPNAPPSPKDTSVPRIELLKRLGMVVGAGFAAALLVYGVASYAKGRA